MPNTYTLIASSTVGSGGLTSVSFNSIPQTYTDLLIKYSVRTNRASAVDGIAFYYNGDTTFTRYTGRELIGDGTSALSAVWPQGNDEISYVSGNSATANTFGSTDVYIPNYSASSVAKSSSVDSAGETNATTVRMNLGAGYYNQTTAISSITFAPVNSTTIQQYSSFYLYGIKNS